MDRAMENLIIRMSGSFALAGLLVHAGLDAPLRPWPGLYLVPFFLASVAANWALARLNVKRPALIATVVLLGIIPVAMPLFHVADMGTSVLYDGVLYALAGFGFVTGLLGLMMLRPRASSE